ncbi:DUF2270 domain-containing protein [Natrinema ejinorense]|uniref:DUF2270 domain-containing protein n=1 Tax=Natrinema ejinorense TaxID=373386 RepID=A0A2A5QQ26_9EURY|nr:DUF2270 domain-containing protein [Natrinema ejinorense]PCR88961.1 hypothetical protein CP557_21035 [Natrinema ejinorense]
MDRESTKDVDPTDTDHREIGQGLLEADMGPSSALAHLYRGEIHRMQFWRERLDQTTYWAIVVMSAILTWSFSSRTNPHYVVLLGAAAVTAFLVIEARRYRGYDIWRGRVRTLQKNVFAYGLDPSAGLEDPGWRETLSQDYRRPTIKITTEEAIAHRLRRIYMILYTIILGAWVTRVTAFASRPWPESAAVGEIPGLAVTAVVAACYLLAVVVTVRPRTWEAEDELHEAEIGQHR